MSDDSSEESSCSVGLDPKKKFEAEDFDKVDFGRRYYLHRLEHLQRLREIGPSCRKEVFLPPT